MAMDQTGIMALPEADQAGPSSLPVEEYYDASKSALREANPKAAEDMDAVMQSIMADVQGMSDEELDAMIEIVQEMHDNPDQYPQLRAKLIADGQADEEDLPPEYDPEFLAVALSVLIEAKRSRSAAPAGPQGFAKGGIASAAEALAKKGRYGDTMLAHITPREARMLQKKGGSGTINPQTGMPEFFLKGLFKGIGNAVKKILNNPIGKIVATIALTTVLGPLGAWAAPIASAGTTLLAGGNVKDAFKSAAFTYLSGADSPISGYVKEPLEKLGLQGTALQAATSGLIGTGAGLLTGQKFSDAVKTGLTSAAIHAGSSMLNQARATAQGPGTAAGPAPGPLAKTAAEVAAQQGAGAPATLPQAPVPSIEREGMPGYRGAMNQIQAPGAPAQVQAPQVPTMGESLSQIGKGIGLGEGPANLEDVKGGLGKLFSPGLSNEQLRQTPEYQDALAKGKTMTEALQQASKSYDPGILRSYGPAVAAGIGALGMAGGFKAKPIQPGPIATGMSTQLARERQMLAENPGMFTPKGFERFGAVYNDKGQIVDWNTWSPESAGAFNQYNMPRNTSASMYGLGSLPTAPVHMADGGAVPTNFSAQTAAAVTKAYLDNLGREPTPQETAYWVGTQSAANPMSQIVANIGIASAQERASRPAAPAPAPVSAPAPAPVSAPTTQLTPDIARDLMYRSMTTGAPTSEFDKYGGYDKVAAMYEQSGGRLDLGSIPSNLQQQYANQIASSGSGNLSLLGMTGTQLTPAGIQAMLANGISPKEIERAKQLYGSPTPGTAGVVPSQGTPSQNPFYYSNLPTSPWNSAPLFSDYAKSVEGTPVVATPSVLGLSTYAPRDPFAAGRNNLLQYLVPMVPMVPQPYNTSSMYSGLFGSSGNRQALASGGIAGLREGGYPRRTGKIEGPGTETSDSIPAMLSDGEFVMTAQAVRGAGGGDRREGAKKMYALMHRLEKNAAKG